MSEGKVGVVVHMIRILGTGLSSHSKGGPDLALFPSMIQVTMRIIQRERCSAVLEGKTCARYRETTLALVKPDKVANAEC